MIPLEPERGVRRDGVGDHVVDDAVLPVVRVRSCARFVCENLWRSRLLSGLQAGVAACAAGLGFRDRKRGRVEDRLLRYRNFGAVACDRGRHVEFDEVVDRFPVRLNVDEAQTLESGLGRGGDLEEASAAGGRALSCDADGCAGLFA